MERTRQYRSWRLTASDAITLGMLAVVLALLSLRLPAVPGLASAWTQQAALLLGFGVACVVLNGIRADWAGVVRALVTVGVLFAVYVMLAEVAFKAVPWTADALLSRMDAALFGGRTPALDVGAPVLGVEGWSFVYGFFIPYLYFSIVLGLAGRPAHEREEFITGFAFTYAISFLGYLLAPARGPIVQHAAEFGTALEGGFFHHHVVDSIDRMGGPHGAFPSLHVGASAYLCLFDLRKSPLRGLLYVPVVSLIAVSAVVLRYHYVVDLLAGGMIAGAGFLVARRWSRA